MREIALYAPLLAEQDIVSLYFGGGTPYLLGAKKVGHVIQEISCLSNLSPSAEITLESNPEQITYEELGSFRSVGINRLSVGVQSFHEKELRLLERPRITLSSVMDDIARSGFTNISLDLMYDLPWQTIESWRSTLDRVLSLPITHLSLYNLTIEPKTAFFYKKEKLISKMPSEEQSLLLYQAAVEKLEQAGFMQYEISAFARQGKRSLHNIGYWTARPYLGFGPSASGFYSLIRYTNRSNLREYVHALSENTFVFDSIEQVSKEARLRELLAVGLRYFDGVSLSLLEQVVGAPFSEETTKKLGQLVEDAFLKKNDLFQLTERGKLVYDSIASELI